MLPLGLRLVASRGCGHGCSSRVVSRAGIRSLGTWANTQGESYSQPLDMSHGQSRAGATAAALHQGHMDMPLPAGLPRATSDAINVPHVTEKLLKAAGGDGKSDAVQAKVKAGKDARNQNWTMSRITDFTSAERAVLDMEKNNDYSRLEKARYEDIKRIIVEHVTDKAWVSNKNSAMQNVERRLRVSYLLLSYLLRTHGLSPQGKFDEELLWPFFRGCSTVGSDLAMSLLTQMQEYIRNAQTPASGQQEGAKRQPRHERHEPLWVPDGLVGLTIAAVYKKSGRKAALELYNEAREDGRKKTKGMYMPLLHHYIDNKHAVEALGIIKDAVDDGAVIPFHIFRAVLELAIEMQRANIIQGLLQVMKVYPTEYRLDRGTIRQVLNTAARWGAVEGLQELWNLKTQAWGQTPQASDFNAVVQAYARVKNDRLALAALNEMICLKHQPSPGTLQFFAQQLATSVVRLDEAYELLVTMKEEHDAALQNGEGASFPLSLTVGRSSLQVIMLGCAWANELDRAFATFEEYQSVFGLKHDVEACNALLFACQRAKNLQVGAAMSVLSEMGRLGVPPNAETYHHVIKILVQSRSDKNKVEDVFQTISESGLEPLPQTLRTLAMYRTLVGDHQGAMAAVQALRHKSYFVPAYLTRRITDRQSQNAAPLVN